jgi:hypothetical protein
MQVVQVVLESLLLRRTKSMKDNDGKAIVELPEKDVSRPQCSSWALADPSARRRSSRCASRYLRRHTS